MNSDQVKGKLEQVIGHVKQGIGEALGDNKTANEGLGDQLKGSAHETWGNVKDAAHTTSTTTHEQLREDTVDHSAEIRRNLSDKIHDAKTAINDRIDEYKETHSK